MSGPGRGTGPRGVAVIGARGFIGSRVVTHLRAAGRDVFVYDRAHPAVVGDEFADPDLASATDVVWAASSINPLIAENYPARVADDAESFSAYLRAAARLAHPPRTVLLSSGGTVYDPTATPPYAETSPTVPRSTYGRAKLGLERALQRSRVPGVVLRIANAYGPGQPVAPGQGVVSHWLRAVAAGQELHVYGDGSTARDYVHVDDVARAVVATTARDTGAWDVFNIGSGRAASLSELLEITRAVVGDHEVRVRRHPARGFDQQATWLDCRHTSDVLGWTAQVSLERGLRETWRAIAHDVAPTPGSVR